MFRKCYTLPQLNTVGGAQPVLGISPPDDGGSAAVVVVVVGARRRSTETTAGFEQRRGIESQTEKENLGVEKLTLVFSLNLLG